MIVQNNFFFSFVFHLLVDLGNHFKTYLPTPMDKLAASRLGNVNLCHFFSSYLQLNVRPRLSKRKSTDQKMPEAPKAPTECGNDLTFNKYLEPTSFFSLGCISVFAKEMLYLLPNRTTG